MSEDGDDEINFIRDAPVHLLLFFKRGGSFIMNKDNDENGKVPLLPDKLPYRGFRLFFNFKFWIFYFFHFRAC